MARSTRARTTPLSVAAPRCADPGSRGHAGLHSLIAQIGQAPPLGAQVRRRPSGRPTGRSDLRAPRCPQLRQTGWSGALGAVRIVVGLET
eukprot:scaffold34446_cov73-Phaeocystis_antarctica.AAC.2